MPPILRRMAGSTILIVEDEPALRLSYDRAFRPRYDLAFASNGAEAMEKLGESGGMAGSIAKFGTAITDMQKNVEGLQKNLDTFKQVKTALGG